MAEVKKLRIGILGAGAIGSFLATLLIKRGHTVVCIVKDDQVEELMKKGLTLESSLFGNLTARASVTAQLSAPVDVLFITVKSPYLLDSLKKIPRELVQGTAIISLLNGVGNVEVIEKVLSRNAVLGTIGSIEVESPSLGVAKHIGTLTPHIELAENADVNLSEVEDVLSDAGIKVDIKKSEAEVLWGKLARLNALASVTAYSGKTVGEVRGDAALFSRLSSIIKEGIQVAKAEGVSLDENAIMELVQKLPENMTMSMQRDIAQGIPSELETITGGVLRKAKSLGVETPVLEETYNLLKEKVNQHG